MYEKKVPHSGAKKSPASMNHSKKISGDTDKSIEAKCILPKHIKVGGITYNVEIVEPNLMDDSIGLTSFRDATIYVSKNSSSELMEETFIHELIHAMLAHSGYVEHDEIMVESLAQTLYGVIKDNDWSDLI